MNVYGSSDKLVNGVTFKANTEPAVGLANYSGFTKGTGSKLNGKRRDWAGIGQQNEV